MYYYGGETDGKKGLLVAGLLVAGLVGYFLITRTPFKKRRGEKRDDKKYSSSAIKGYYRKAGFIPPRGKGIHTQRFHKMAVSIAKSRGHDKVQSGDYAIAMKQLGRNNSVFKSHWVSKYGAEKEPWQMTRKEWYEEFDKDRPSASGSHSITVASAIGKSVKGAEKAFTEHVKRQEWLKMGLPDFDMVTGKPWETLTKKELREGMQGTPRHRQVIMHALKLKKPVPDKVLKDYANLVKKSTYGAEPKTMNFTQFAHSRDYPADGEVLDHGMLSPSGHMSKRAREAGNKRHLERLELNKKAHREYRDEVMAGNIIDPDSKITIEKMTASWNREELDRAKRDLQIITAHISRIHGYGNMSHMKSGKLRKGYRLQVEDYDEDKEKILEKFPDLRTYYDELLVKSMGRFEPYVYKPPRASFVYGADGHRGYYRKAGGDAKDIQDTFWNAGKSAGFKGKYDKKQMEMGKKVEMEHTTDVDIAAKISRDHLAEIPDYYTRLEKMESDAEAEGKKYASCGKKHYGGEKKSIKEIWELNKSEIGEWEGSDCFDFAEDLIDKLSDEGYEPEMQIKEGKDVFHNFVKVDNKFIDITGIYDSEKELLDKFKKEWNVDESFCLLKKGEKYASCGKKHYGGSMKELLLDYAEAKHPDNPDKQDKLMDDIVSGKKKITVLEMQKYIEKKTEYPFSKGTRYSFLDISEMKFDRGIKFKQLSGVRLKKSLRDVGVVRSGRQWHNSNKSGGNFGINFFRDAKTHESGERYMGQINGAYDTHGIVRRLSFTDIGFPKERRRGEIFYNAEHKEWTYDKLIDFLKDLI